MTFQQRERRVDVQSDSATGQASADLVRKGLLIQYDTGTVGAIEYLKASGIGAAVIQRVLSGNAMRVEDRLMLDNHAATAVV
jgi:hypothetical protein